MAEAHSAVAFSFAVTHEGLDVNFDREVLHLVYQSGVRSWKKRIARFKVTCFLQFALGKLNFASHLFAFFAAPVIDVRLSPQDVSIQDAALAIIRIPRFHAQF
jgi:hypothetical protein